MIEFNPDGSLKLPASVMRAKEENVQRLKSQRCMKIEKEIVNFTAPKKCHLKITLSEAFSDSRFIENIYNYFKTEAVTPTKIIKNGEREFIIAIDTDFKRCSDCTALINRYREFLDGNVIEKKGNCTFEGRIRSWSEEDYFD